MELILFLSGATIWKCMFKIQKRSGKIDSYLTWIEEQLSFFPHLDFFLSVAPQMTACGNGLKLHHH